MIIKIKQNQAKQRLDKFLTAQLPITRSQIKKLIQTEKITVNDKGAAVHRFLMPGDKIKILNSEISKQTKPKILEPNPKVKFKIVFEDNDIIVIDKKSGIIVHPTEKMETNTLANGLLAYYPEIKNIGDNSLRPGIVHRLDKDVSGLMLVCKTQKSFEYFKKQFQNRKIKKIYTVLVHGVMEKPHDIINMPIARSKKGGKMAVRTQQQKGKEAITKYEVKKQYNNFALLNVEILTGRTHQIRAHFNALNHPVVGDKLYAQKKVKAKIEIDRPFLHSTILGFTDLQKQEHEFKSELPAKLKNILKQLQ